MIWYIARRIVYLVPTLFIVSIIAFAVIQLPPGDFLASLISSAVETVDQAQVDALRQRYGLDEPIYVQYWKWISGIIIRGDFGDSFEWNRPVSDLIWERLGLTMDFVNHAGVCLDCFHSHRHILSRKKIYDWRLYCDRNRIRRSGGTEFSACTGAYVYCIQVFWAKRWRSVLTGIHRR